MKRRYCHFHRKDGDHFSSECHRNPAILRNSRRTEEELKRSSSRSNNKPTSSKLPTPKHPGKPEASKYLRKIKQLFSSSEDEKENTPELVTLDEEEQKEIDALGRDTEDEATKTDKVEDNEEEQYEKEPRSSPLCNFEDKNLPSLSKSEESASDVDDREPAQTSKIAANNERMKKKIKILEKEIKIAEMKTEIIKYEINNVNSIQDMRQLKKKHKINL